MLNRIGLITIVTRNLEMMKRFYRDVMKFECIEELDEYIEFKSLGVRFALTTDDVMYNATKHLSYLDEKKGQRLELAFPLSHPDAVGVAYDKIVSAGAVPVASPEMMPWGRMTAFFADPDGNIHELYSLKPGEKI